jgi:hypothetical protein
MGREGNPGEADRSRSHLERTAAVVGLLSALVGVPALVLAGRPYTSIALLAALILGPAALLTWLARSRRTSRRVVLPSVVAAVLSYAVAAALLATSSGRGFLFYAALPVPGSDRPQISQLQVPEGDGFLRIRLVLNNESADPKLAKHLQLYVDSRRASACGETHYYRYALKDDATVVSRSTGYRTITGTVEDTLDIVRLGELGIPRASNSFEGTLIGDTCQGFEVLLEFDISATLAEKSYTTLDVDVPEAIAAPPGERRFKVVDGWTKISATVTFDEGDEKITVEKQR